MGTGFYGLNDPTNSVKALKEHTKVNEKTYVSRTRRRDRATTLQSMTKGSKNLPKFAKKVCDMIAQPSSLYTTISQLTNFGFAAETGPVKCGELLAVVLVEVRDAHLCSLWRRVSQTENLARTYCVPYATPVVESRHSCLTRSRFISHSQSV